MVAASHFFWLLSRSTGIVSLFALSFSCVFGVLLASRPLRGSLRPAWVLALHRHAALLFFAFLVLHLLGLALNSFLRFSLLDLFVPLQSRYRAVPVTFGIIAFYLTLAVQVSSRFLLKKISRSTWKSIHLSSYAAFVLVLAHSFLAGTDASSRVLVAVVFLASGCLAMLAALRVAYSRS